MQRTIHNKLKPIRMSSGQLHNFEILGTEKFKIFHHYEQECMMLSQYLQLNLSLLWRTPLSGYRNLFYNGIRISEHHLHASSHYISVGGVVQTTLHRRQYQYLLASHMTDLLLHDWPKKFGEENITMQQK